MAVMVMVAMTSARQIAVAIFLVWLKRCFLLFLEEARVGSKDRVAVVYWCEFELTELVMLRCRYTSMAEKIDCCKAAKKTEDLALRRGGLRSIGCEDCRMSKSFGCVSSSPFVVEGADGRWWFENAFLSIDDQARLALAVLELVAVVELE